MFAGAIAKQILATWGVKIRAGISQVGSVKVKKLDWESVELNMVRSLDPDVAEDMIREIEEVRRNRDSIGGKVYLEAHGVPVGLGEPAFQKLDALIGAAMFSIPAVKGVEIGSGFDSVEAKGSENNDQMNKFGFLTNNHGGVLG